MLTSIRLSWVTGKIKKILFVKWTIPGHFFFIFVCLQSAVNEKWMLYDWIQTQVFWCLNRPLCQLRHNPVWSDLAEICRISKNLEIFGNISMVYLIFGKVVNPLWDFFYIFGQNFIVVNGQILKKQSGHLVTLATTLAPKTIFLDFSSIWSRPARKWSRPRRTSSTSW